MSVWLKITLILLGAMLISFGVSLIPASSLAFSSPTPRAVPDEPLIDAVLIRPPQAAVHACLGPADEATLTLKDFIRLAKCLHRKQFVTAHTVAAVEKSDLGAGGHRIASLKAKTTVATWWWLITWGVALGAIAFVVFRHLRHRPPPSDTAALGR